MSEYFKVKSVQGQSSQGKVRKNPATFLGEGDRDMENCTLRCVCGPNAFDLFTVGLSQQVN